MNYLSVEFLLASFLIFVRIAAMIATAPFFSNQSVPNQIKLFTAIVLTIALFPIIPIYAAVFPMDASILDVLVAIVKEMLVGISMGLVGQMIFAGVQMGGELMSVNMGLSFASVVDPMNQRQSGLLTQLFTFIGILLFLGIGGHSIYIRALAQSFEIVPLGAAQPVGATFSFLEMAMYIFVVAVQMASPFILVLFLLDVSLAIFARIMPQANIFFLSLPLKVGIGVILLIMVLPYTPAAFQHFFNSMWGYLDQVIQSLVP